MSLRRQVKSEDHMEEKNTSLSINIGNKTFEILTYGTMNNDVMQKSYTRIFSGWVALVVTAMVPIQLMFAQSDPLPGKIRIASCQFPVSSDISANLKWISEQMVEAKLKKATVVHFSECALSGYPGVDMESMDHFRWGELQRATDSVKNLASELGLWVLLGSIHHVSGYKPYNSLYVIDPNGETVDRYDKRFCTSGDLKHFSPGDHFVNVDINGVNCGLLICYDVRFPELYREYRRRGTDVIFQSFHNARQKKGSIHPIIMHITAQARAATNYFYMSLTNSSAPQSWPCYFITPDGLVQNKLPANEPGVLISDIDINAKYYDASAPFRTDAMNGKLNSGEVIKAVDAENNNAN